MPVALTTPLPDEGVLAPRAAVSPRPSPAALQPAPGPAVSAAQALEARGWTFCEARPTWPESTRRVYTERRTPLSPAALVEVLSHPSAQIVPPDVRAEHPVHGRTSLRTVDEVQALGFFEADAAAEALDAPDTARRLRAMRERGIDFRVQPGRVACGGALDAYRLLKRGISAEATLCGAVLGTSNRADALEAALAPHTDLLAAWREVVVPALRDGLLDPEHLKQGAGAMRDASQPPRQTAAWLIALARALQKRPEAATDAMVRTRAAAEALQAMLATGLPNDNRDGAAAEYVGLVERLGVKDAASAARYLWQDLPLLSVLAPCRERRAGALHRCVAAGLGWPRAREAADWASRSVDPESLEGRLALIERVGQIGAADPLSDVRAIEQFRRPEEPLAEAARPYLLLLGAMAARDEASLTADVWASLHEIAQSGGEPVQAVLERFLSALLTSSAEWSEALRSAAAARQAAVGDGVVRGDGFVVIGSVRVPARAPGGGDR